MDLFYKCVAYWVLRVANVSIVRRRGFLCEKYDEDSGINRTFTTHFNYFNTLVYGACIFSTMQDSIYNIQWTAVLIILGFKCGKCQDCALCQKYDEDSDIDRAFTTHFYYFNTLVYGAWLFSTMPVCQNSTAFFVCY